MLADGKHMGLANVAALDAGNHLGQSGFEAIFHAHLKGQIIARHLLHHLCGIGQSGAKRLLA